MERLSADEVRVAVVCALCVRETPAEDLDFVDVGQDAAAHPVCVQCWLEIDEQCSQRDPGQPLPEDLDWTPGDALDEPIALWPGELVPAGWNAEVA
jgi:hypothetical protein